MAFVKLDTGILRSTLWIDRTAREVFITALLMAQPREIRAPMDQLEVRTLNKTGWTIPPGWYGWVDAAGVGICREAIVEMEIGIAALERLGSPEPDSRSSAHEGRRLVRVDGGYVVLNYMAYRDRDEGAAERMRRYRERHSVTRNRDGVTRHVTHAEGEVEEKAEREKTRVRATPDAKTQPDADPAPGLDPAAWSRWLEYRTEIRKPLKPASIPAAQKALAAHGCNQAAVVEQSIANGWQGLFALKDQPKGARNPEPRRELPDAFEVARRTHGG